MFGFISKLFKQKELTPKEKLINNYIERMKDLDKLREKNGDIIDTAIETVKSDMKLIGEMYASFNEKETIELFHDKLEKTDINKLFLTPIGTFNRHITLIGDVGVGYLVNNLQYVANPAKQNEDRYIPVVSLMRKRNNIKKSKLKGKLKDLYIKKNLEDRYNAELYTANNGLFSKEVETEMLAEFSIDKSTIKDIVRFKYLHSVNDSAEVVDCQTLVSIDDTYFEEMSVLDKYTTDMCLKNNISLIKEL